MLGSTILLAFGALALRWATEPEIKDLLVVILTPVVALTGSAVGFYFGGKTRDT